MAYWAVLPKGVQESRWSGLSHWALKHLSAQIKGQAGAWLQFVADVVAALVEQ